MKTSHNSRLTFFIGVNAEQGGAFLEGINLQSL